MVFRAGPVRLQEQMAAINSEWSHIVVNSQIVSEHLPTLPSRVPMQGLYRYIVNPDFANVLPKYSFEKFVADVFERFGFKGNDNNTESKDEEAENIELNDKVFCTICSISPELATVIEARRVQDHIEFIVRCFNEEVLERNLILLNNIVNVLKFYYSKHHDNSLDVEQYTQSLPFATFRSAVGASIQACDAIKRFGYGIISSVGNAVPSSRGVVDRVLEGLGDEEAHYVELLPFSGPVKGDNEVKICEILQRTELEQQHYLSIRDRYSNDTMLLDLISKGSSLAQYHGMRQENRNFDGHDFKYYQKDNWIFFEPFAADFIAKFNDLIASDHFGVEASKTELKFSTAIRFPKKDRSNAQNIAVIIEFIKGAWMVKVIQRRQLRNSVSTAMNDLHKGINGTKTPVVLEDSKQDDIVVLEQKEDDISSLESADDSADSPKHESTSDQPETKILYHNWQIPNTMLNQLSMDVELASAPSLLTFLFIIMAGNHSFEELQRCSGPSDLNFSLASWVERESTDRQLQREVA